MKTEQLQELGLTRNESLVYTALLGLGETKTGPIVKKTGLHRVLIYDALNSLIKKGLASSVTKENIKYFQAADPNSLVEFLEEKKAAANELLPELKAIQKSNEGKQLVTVYEGVKGLKSAMSNMIKELTSKDYHYVFASGNMAPTVGDYYYLYQQEKRKKKIPTKTIYDMSFRAHQDIIKATYATIKFYPLGPFQTDTWIYKDKVLIVVYTANPPIATLIQSRETANSYKNLFESLWKKAREK